MLFRESLKEGAHGLAFTAFGLFKPSADTIYALKKVGLIDRFRHNM